VPAKGLSVRVWGVVRERGYALGMREFRPELFDPADDIPALESLLGDDT
jgi:hypothetical protein